MFEERKIQYLYPEDYDALSSAFLPHVVLQLELQGRITYLDFGTILYKRHTTVNKKTHAASVYKNTLFIGLIEPLHEYILNMVQKYSHASIKHFFRVIRNVIKDLNLLYEKIELYEKEQALEIYQKYTQYLIMDRATKLKNSIADMGIYNRKQMVLAQILARSLQIDIQEIKNSYIEVASKHKKHNQPVEAEKLSIFFELNKRIFSTFSKFFLNKETLPVNITFEEYNIGVVSGNGKYSTLRIFTPTSFNDIQHGIFA